MSLNPLGPPLRRAGTIVALGAAALTILSTSPREASGDPQDPTAFHLNEITKLMAGFNGDATIQAVELKMLTDGENLVGGVSIRTYDAGGVLQATLGTFAGSIPNGTAGARILCATANFQATFGITADLTITAGIPATTGQVAFETGTCRVNVLPYGAVTVPLGGPSAAPPLPTGGATVLVRTTDSPTSFCPLSVPEDAAARFGVQSGSSGSPIPFQNNAGASVNVFSTVAAVDPSPPAPGVLRVSPNPFRGTTRIEAPGWSPLTIHDVRGRLVRVLTCTGACPAVAGPFRGEWDGTDARGEPVPSGVYFLRYAGPGGPAVIRRIALIR
jgi:hypothetical protein